MSSISRETRIIHMNEIQKRKVVEHNDLITSVAKMDKVPLKIFELAVSCIDTDNPPKDHIVYLSKQELFAFFDVSSGSKHSRFKQAVERMQKQAYFAIREEKGKGFEYENIVPVPYIKWNDYNDEVTIRFDIAIMPYLIDLKTNFTQYALSDLMELNSKHSIIIYKWLCMQYNQYEHYQHKGNRTHQQLEEYKNPLISIEELRKLTDTENEYKRADHFEQWILKTPIQEISKHTHFTVSYEKIKKGRSIVAIQFFIEKNAVQAPVLYKEEQQDLIYLEDQKQKEHNQQTLFAEAMQSPYTKLLIENFLLSPMEMTDLDLMANLQKVVYPLYDQLKEKKGLDGVKEHLSYVRGHMDGYSQTNLVKYLETSVKQYVQFRC